MPVDVSVVVNLHSEGMLAHSSLVSVRKAKDLAESRGLSVEVLVVLDRPDRRTLDFIDDFRGLDFRRIEVDFGDAGLSRNVGVDQAHGRWIAFLDGDDMWGENWLVAACAAASAEPRPVIWHPQVNLYFGVSNRLFVHVDMEDPDFDIASLAITNYWTALSFASRDLYREVPYPRSLIDQQLGFEDWSWNCETIALGVLHKCVAGTAHVIREKQVSLLRRTSASQALMYPTRLFRACVGLPPGQLPGTNVWVAEH